MPGAGLTRVCHDGAVGCGCERMLGASLVFTMSCHPASPRVGPTFLGVGPEKTGTTWIHRQLQSHPDVWVPDVKELRYFWERHAFPGEHPLVRLFNGGSWHRRQARYFLWNRMRHYATHPHQLVAARSQLAWDWRFLFRRRDDAWYLACFKDANKPVRGEISPQYFMLPEEAIAHAARLAPDAKILVSLRKPDDWLWSYARMGMRDGALGTDAESVDRYIATMARSASLSRALGQWRSHYPGDRLGIVWYDQLQADPWGFYREICQFLNIVPDRSRQSHIAERVNVGHDEPMPERFRERVAAAYRDDVRAIAQMVDVPSAWLDLVAGA